MTKDTRSDEALVEVYWEGDQRALETLLNRYLTPILGYLFSISFFKDETYLDDIRQQIFLTVFEWMRSKRFVPRGPGTFKKWLYRIAYFECIKTDKSRRKGAKTISEVFPEEPTGFPDDLIVQTRPQSADYERAYRQLQKVTKHLTPNELKLIRLVCEKKPYKEIIKEPEFTQFGLDYLMLKVYNIKKKIRKITEKERKNER